MSIATADWASEIRRVGREIAANYGSASTSESSQNLGWPLWQGVTLTGEERMKDGLPPVFWTYWTKLALRTDGEIVAFDTNDGRTSPNLTFSSGVRLAEDEILLYPDVTRWEEQSSIEEAEIRTIIDTFRVPAEYSEPRGTGLMKALEDLRSTSRSPEALGEVVLPRTPEPPTAQKKSLMQRLFG